MSGGQCTCPRCGGTGLIDADAEAVEAIIVELRESCAELTIAVGMSGTVSEADAARLLDRAPATLANWRFAGCPIPYQKIGSLPPKGWLRLRPALLLLLALLK